MRHESVLDHRSGSTRRSTASRGTSLLRARRRGTTRLVAFVLGLAASGVLDTAALPLGATPLHAQTPASITLRGQVRTATGVPLDEVLVRLRADTGTVAESRSLSSGQYSMPRLDPGEYTLDVRRIGFESRVLPVRLGEDRTLRVDVVLSPLAVPIAPTRGDEPWTGVLGVVGTFADMEPLDGVRVRVLGRDSSVTSDAAGRFALPLPPGTSGALRLERDGYVPRLVSYRVTEEGPSELAVLLDAGALRRSDAGVWRDVLQRHQWSTPRAVRVSRAELLQTGAHNLLVALEAAPTVQQSNLIFSRNVCLFVNGLPRPGFPLDAILTDRVEYVEGYANRGDLSRTLAVRWPANGVCGVPGGELTVRRAIESGQGIQYVVVWLR
jgi:hypothetical protein